MLKFLFALQLVVCAISAPAAQVKFDVLKVGSITFSNVTVIGVNATDLYFNHSTGISNVKLKYLTPELQKKFHYNPAEAAKAEKQHSEDDVRYQGELAAAAARHTNTNSASDSHEKLLDPLTENSLVGKPAPRLTFDTWLGDKPDLTNRYTLLVFFASWSIPCQKSLPQIASIQKKFSDKLQVVFVSPETKADLETIQEKLKLPMALDPKSTAAASLGISAIPSVALLDPKSKVLYLGHPAGLNDSILEQVIAKRD
jgi:thiol-disulfide isomerase/thioredoxin